MYILVRKSENLRYGGSKCADARSFAQHWKQWFWRFNVHFVSQVWRLEA